MHLLNLAIALVLIQQLVFGVLVGRARGLYGVKAPATSGHELFDRHYRVQMNTLELIVLLVPAAYLAARWLPEAWVAGLVGVYLVGRVLYAVGYVRDPKARGPGFLLSMLPIMALLVAAVIAAVRGA